MRTYKSYEIMRRVQMKNQNVSLVTLSSLQTNHNMMNHVFIQEMYLYLCGRYDQLISYMASIYLAKDYYHNHQSHHRLHDYNVYSLRGMYT